MDKRSINVRQMEMSAGPSKQRGCVGHERGSIVWSGFFFGSFLFINGKEMNGQATEREKHYN